MAAKPSTVVGWATTGGTTVEPTSGQKAAGFAVSTRPPARWFNWIINFIDTWLTYLKDGVLTNAESKRVGAPGSVQVLSGSGTYTTPAKCSSILVRAWGGGGGGGGTTVTDNDRVAVGGGGQAGSYAEKLIVGPGASYAYVVGAKGAGVVGGAGAAGSDTTFNGTTVVAKGGSGGAAGSLVTPPSIPLRTPSTTASTGDVTCIGQQGGVAFALSLYKVHGGDGGHSAVGLGGNGGDGTSGSPGAGFASGGGGLAVTVGTAMNGSGQAGADGTINILEFY